MTTPPNHVVLYVCMSMAHATADVALWTTLHKRRYDRPFHHKHTYIHTYIYSRRYDKRTKRQFGPSRALFAFRRTLIAGVMCE
jgi:hypothetical protein